MMNLKKFLAIVLTIASLAAITAAAEAPVTENAAVEEQLPVAAESLLGANIDETGAALGLEKTQTQDDEAFLTLYEDADITIGGHDGAVVYMSIFSDKYEMFGVKLGMTMDVAKAALDANSVAYTEGEIAELGIPTLEFAVPGSETEKGTIEFGSDNLVCTIQIYYDNGTEEEPAPTAEPKKETSKATSPVKANGYIKLTGNAYLRKSASKESKSLQVMKKGTKLQYSATAKDSRGVTWYKVKNNGKTGWVSSKNTTKIKKSEYNSKATSPKKASGYIELTGKCNVRKSPDKSSRSLDVFGKGAVLKFTATAKDSRGVKWYKVSADGVTGWISSKYAKETK